MQVKGQVITKGSYDILVAGGGVAGVAAAVSAARAGKKVILLEKSVKLGGLATLGLVNMFVPMCNGRGKQIIFGMAEEFLRLAIRYGYDSLPDEFENGKIPKEKLKEYQEKGQLPPRYKTRFSAELFALSLTKLCVEAGVSVQFDSTVIECVTNDHSQTLLGVIAADKSGLEYYEAKMFVDTTGDCELYRKLGMQTILRDNFHTYMGLQISLDSCEQAVKHQNIGYATKYCWGGKVNLYGQDAQNQDDASLKYNATSAEDINRYLIRNQLEMLEQFTAEEKNKRDVVALPGMPQMRTACCIDAEYMLEETDAFQHFEDSVGVICDFDRRDYLFEIPYRTMYCHKISNVITAGRTACAKNYAWDVLRVIPPAIITGQAAGNACAQAIDEGCTLSQINIQKLQGKLEKENVSIHFSDTDIAENRNAIHENQDDLAAEQSNNFEKQSQKEAESNG